MSANEIGAVGANSTRVLQALLVVTSAGLDFHGARAPGEARWRRSELILADAGFSAAEISTFLGKSYEGVRSAIRRDQAAQAKQKDATQ